VTTLIVEEKLEKVENLRKFSEQLVAKQKAFDEAYNGLVACYEDALGKYDVMVKTFKKKHAERKIRLEKFMEDVKALEGETELDELEKQVLQLLIARLSRK